MTVTPHVYADIAVKQDQLIRKALDGSVFGAFGTSADLITALTVDGPDTGTPTLALLPDGWTDFGLLSADGAQFSSSVDTTDITSWGRVEPSRRDITKDITTLKILMQETKLATLAAYFGVDPSTIVPTSLTGEVHIVKPSRPTALSYQLFALGVDQNDHGEIYCAAQMPRAQLTDKGDLSLMSGDDGVFYDTTWTAFTDAVAGYAVEFIFGGPGWKPMLADMGWE